MYESSASNRCLRRHGEFFKDAARLLRIGSRFEKEKVETMSVAFTREESAETAAEVELRARSNP